MFAETLTAGLSALSNLISLSAPEAANSAERGESLFDASILEVEALLDAMEKLPRVEASDLVYDCDTALPSRQLMRQAILLWHSARDREALHSAANRLFQGLTRIPE